MGPRAAPRRRDLGLDRGGGVSFFVFERMPHIDDSIAYLFQAKYFSTGALWLPRPVDPDSFGVAHLIVDGDKWYSKFFPGWPAVLALGVLLGAPWIVNPLLGAASVLLLHSLTTRSYGLRTAHAVTLLVSASPWFLFLSGSFMAHSASLFWMLLALVGIERLRGRSASGWGLVAGSSLGMLFLTRPFDAALVGPVIGLSALGVGPRRLTLVSLAMVGVSAALVAGLYFPYNAALTGDPFAAPHRLWAEHLFGSGVDVFGFGPSVGIPLWRNMDPLPGHGLADVVLNANKNFALLNFELFGWACGSLVMVCLAFRRGALGRNDVLMLGLLFAVVVGHAFYWAPGGPDFGARYWYLIIMPLVVLTVRGAEHLASGSGGGTASSDVAGTRVGVALAFASLCAVLVIVPWRSVGKYYRYRDIGGTVGALTDRRGIRDALIFVRSSRRSDYQTAFNLNPRSTGDDGNVFAWDLGPDHRAAVLSGFPSKPVWVIERTDQADSLSVTQGPLPAGTNPAGNAPDVPVSFQAVLR